MIDAIAGTLYILAHLRPSPHYYFYFTHCLLYLARSYLDKLV